MIAKKRGTISVDMVVTILLAVVVFLALLNFFGGTFMRVLESSGEDQGCVFSAAANALTKTFGTTFVNLKCPTHTTNLVYDGLKVPIPDKKLEKLKSWWPNFYELYKRDTLTKETKNDLSVLYNANLKIATEMKSCWNKLGRGNLNLFEQDWAGIKYEEGTFSEGESWKTDLTKKTVEGLKVWKLTIKESPQICVICATITADEKTVAAVNKMKNEFPTESSFTAWLQKNPVNVLLPKPESYYEFLLDQNEKLDKEGIFLQPSYDYGLAPQMPLAVVFIRTQPMWIHEKVGQTFEFLKGIFTSEPKVKGDIGIDAIGIIPYSKIRNSCDMLKN